MMTTAVLCMALNIYHEARGEPYLGQIAVAHVVMNRVKDSRWPTSVCAVIGQKAQFSWTETTREAPKDEVSLSQAIRIAKMVVQGECLDPTNGATHYHHKDINPRWARNLTVTYRKGNHVFLR